MRELEYPYKSEYIIKKIKQFKRELLQSGKKFLDVKIAILAGSTVNALKDLIEIFLLNRGIKPDFYLSEYNKYYEDAVFENPKLKEFNPDIVYIFTTFRNVNNDFDLGTNEDEIENKLNIEIEKYKSIWTSIEKKYNAIIIQNNFEYPNYRLLGNKDISDFHGFSNFLMRLNNKFYEYAKKEKNFYICDINYIAANFGLSKWHNEKLYALYKLPCDMCAFVDVAYNVSSIIKSIYGKNKKAFAFDLDNTLWGNVISEDGLDGIEIGPETPLGEIYLDFQKYIKKVQSLGIILNVVSKNDKEVALNGIENSDGVLKKDDFIKIKANWEPKSENIKNLSKELSLGEDSFVFVDDNPVERDIVEKNVKGIAVPDIGSAEKYIEIIDKSEFFEVTNITKEDLEKTKQYKENALREDLKSNFENYEDYLNSLDMRAEIKPFTSKYYDRISQLSNKSNQFNLTTKRYTVEDIKSVSEDENYITLYGKLIDKFGDNGIVSLIVARIVRANVDIVMANADIVMANADTLGANADIVGANADIVRTNADIVGANACGALINDEPYEHSKICEIELLLMSCRVLKRDMEFAMMDELVRVCREKGIDTIKGAYLKTEKNSMVKNLYEDFGFTKISEDENGNAKYILDNLQNYHNRCHVIKI